MDETIGVGVGPAERAHHAGADGPTPEPRRRMSVRRKQETVLRLLRGEDLELVSRDLAVTAAELSGWRDQFLAGGEASLKSRPGDARDAASGRLQAKVGELTMTAELLQAKTSVWRCCALWPAGGRGHEPADLALHGPSLWPQAGQPFLGRVTGHHLPTPSSLEGGRPQATRAAGRDGGRRLGGGDPRVAQRQPLP